MYVYLQGTRSIESCPTGTDAFWYAGPSDIPLARAAADVSVSRSPASRGRHSSDSASMPIPPVVPSSRVECPAGKALDPGAYLDRSRRASRQQEQGQIDKIENRSRSDFI